MNYEIIKDEKILKEFIEWLPVLENTETYYLCLFARSKYMGDMAPIKFDKTQLKRFTSRREDIFKKIKQLECSIGSYMLKDMAIPQETLALYITPNPRDMWKATISSLVHLAHCIQNDNRAINPHQEVMSEIQRNKSRTCFVDFDFDTKISIEELKAHVYKHVNPEAVQFLQTRGGFHALVTPDMIAEEFKKTWYNGIKSHEDIDKSGDQLLPVPGCTQGNFIPRFI
ncbi:hypothetical protein SAMN05518672_10439 [Chitinophaga sp. CF118]|uniref:hypothetical protein n=1 Tax=Chitinophaga sp. CF118 TaxID=1884367 RepID=UPI0008E5204B|nr:hypothetical protein [Chitinophaga sp. CF118]SFD98503.1 hypothetical protein SAMN05518672_10439 [Chitinophaga sp. CF118]